MGVQCPKVEKLAACASHSQRRKKSRNGKKSRSSARNSMTSLGSRQAMTPNRIPQIASQRPSGVHAAFLYSYGFSLGALLSHYCGRGLSLLAAAASFGPLGDAGRTGEAGGLPMRAACFRYD